MLSVQLPHTHTHTQTTQIQSDHSKSLRVFSSNVRGLIKHWDPISQINLNNYDILLFNEIWQVKDHEVLIIENFKLANLKQRDGRKGGGVIIFVRENIIAEKIDSPFINGVIETAAIKINNAIFTSLYRPPSGNKQTFVENLQDWILSLNNRDVYIAGDFNLNVNGTDKEFFDSIESTTGLKPSITEVTRIASNNCIDNILTTIQGTHRVTTIAIADHLGLKSNLKIKVN